MSISNNKPGNDDGSSTQQENVQTTKVYERESILDVKRFKERFLFGVDLRRSDGVELPDTTIEQFLIVALDYVQMELNVPILPREEVYFADYDFAQYRNFVFFQVPVYPIVQGSVTSVRLHFTDTIGIDFPEDWFRVYATSGQIQLLPNVSTLSAVLISQAGQLLPRAIHSTKAPQLLRINYMAGIADLDDCVPPTINQAIGLTASISLLQMLGDIGPGGGAGISSQSLSLDGMSQTINTAISATNNLYGATIEAYRKQLNDMTMKVLKRKYKRLHLEFI